MHLSRESPVKLVARTFMSVFPGFYASMQKYVSKLGQFPFADNYWCLF